MPNLDMEDLEQKPPSELDTTSESESETEKMPPSSRSLTNMGRRCASVERLKEETRLVLLDFLGSLPSEKITARNLTQSENRPERLKQAMAVAKSSSDAAAYESNRKRFQQMAVPLRRKLSLNLKSEIENFNPRQGLKRRSYESTRTHASKIKKNSIVYERDSSKIKERPRNLQISPNTNTNDCLIVSTPVLSPEGRVAAMLEKIGQEVMETYPNLLDEPLELTRGWNFDNFTYEQFEKAARKVTIDSCKDRGLVGWSKIALLCYFAREITLEAPTELSDKDLVKLAEYTLRFIEETTGEWMEKQGGWAGLEVEEDEEILTAETLAVKYREQEDSTELRKLKEARRISGRRSRDSGSWNSWAKYGIAALAVGVGLCYSLIRH